MRKSFHFNNGMTFRCVKKKKKVIENKRSLKICLESYKMRINGVENSILGREFKKIPRGYGTKFT